MLTPYDPRFDPFDDQGRLKPWARAINAELTAPWCPTEPTLDLNELLARVWRRR